MLGFIVQLINYPLYKDIIASPDKDNPLKCRQDNYMESKYLTIKQTGDKFYDAMNQNGFSIMHCNARSLGKNLFLLHDILISVKSLPDIIAISETKLNDTTSANLHIPGYLLIHLTLNLQQVALVFTFLIN